MERPERAAAAAHGETREPVVSRRNYGQWLSASGSAVALIVSGVSLWETVLKQPSLRLHVGQSIVYTRDPWGSYEVFVVPVTITNSGAQNGAVMSLRLELANAETGVRDVLESAYTADASWFAGSDNVTSRTKRPKSPFSPLSIAGRSSWSGTILFYSPDYREKKVAEPKSELTGNLSISTPGPEGWLDRLVVRQPPQTVQLSLRVPNFLPGALLTGDVARVKVAVGAPLPSQAAAAPAPGGGSQGGK